jgi:hypothetical protein
MVEPVTVIVLPEPPVPGRGGRGLGERGERDGNDKPEHEARCAP